MDSTQKDLEMWEERILEKAEAFGLSCYPQDFEICDSEQMLAYMAYHGMPSHYPHWSFGKSFEKLKTLYNYGVSGLPYEMVINSNPALAYLMRDNSLCLQILTMAHVLGHNDFFRNNFTFGTTDARDVIMRCKVHADRVRGYIEDPSIGIAKVEKMLDAAHALSHQCRRNLASPRLNKEQQRERIRDRFRVRRDEFSFLQKREEFDDKGFQEAMRKNPLEPDEDILLFIRDNNHYLSEWERDLLTIVHEEARYFIPMIETKTMNEGWASFWHREIMNSLNLPKDLYLEFLVRHNQVVRPHPGSLNPYHIGLTMFDRIRVWYDGSLDLSSLEKVDRVAYEAMRHDYEERGVESLVNGATVIGPPDTGKKTGYEKIFEIRAVDRDPSFFRQYLSPYLMREMDLYRYEPSGTEFKITEVADGNKENWKKIRDALIQNTGTNGTPVIKIEDADFEGKRTLLLKHDFDGRELLEEYTEHTLKYVQALWGQDVRLETVVGGKERVYTHNGSTVAKK